MVSSTSKPALWLPVGLLVLAIVTHGVAIERHDADPQRGSAFAMFASVDIHATRRVIATAYGEAEVALELSGVAEELSDRLRDTPTEAGARALAESLAESTWEVEDGTATIGGVTRFDELRVQIVGLDADGRSISRQVFVDVAVSRPSR